MTNQYKFNYIETNNSNNTYNFSSKNIDGDMELFGLLSKKFEPLLKQFDPNIYFKSILYKYKDSTLPSKFVNNMKNVCIDLKHSNTSSFNYNYMINNVYEFDKYLYHLDTGSYGSIFRIDSEYCLKLIFKSDYTHEYYLPIYLNSILEKSCEYLSKFINVPNFIIKNIPNSFVYKMFYNHNFIMFFMVSAMRGEMVDMRNNLCNTETILRNYDFLFNNNSKNNYIIFTAMYNIIANKDTEFMIGIHNYKKLVNLIKTCNIHELLNIVVSRLAIATSDTLKLNEDGEPDMINGKLAKDVNIMYIRHVILQIILVICNINKHIFFTHNDLKPNNILVFESNEHILIPIGNHTAVFKEPYMFKLNDFDFSNVSGFKNTKLSTSHKSTNILYDVRFFLETANMFFNIETVDAELYAFINNCIYIIGSLTTDTVVSKHISCIDTIENIIVDNGIFKNWIN